MTTSFYPSDKRGQRFDEHWFLAVPKDINDIENIQKIYEILEPQGVYKITGTRDEDDCGYYSGLEEVGDFPCVASLTLLDIVRVGTTTDESPAQYWGTATFKNISNPDDILLARTNEELCKPNAFTALLDQEVKFNQEIIEDKFIQHLRFAIDNFLNKKYESIEACGGYYGYYQGKYCEDSAYNPTTGPVFFFEDNDFLRSKFIVLYADTASVGGMSINLMFKDKPDQIFCAWVYGRDDYYDLRGFYNYNHEAAPNREDVPSPREAQKIFINQLCNQEAGI